MPFAFPEDCLGDFRIAGASSGGSQDNWVPPGRVEQGTSFERDESKTYLAIN